MVQGKVEIGGLGQNWRSKTIDALTKVEVKDILQKAFCDHIPSCYIVTGSCGLQVLDYNEVSGVADYILTFDQLLLEDSLNDINAAIAENPAVPAAIKDSVKPGAISKCIY